MSLSKWAQNEVNLAIEASKENTDFNCSCYEIALKTFESLIKDTHNLDKFLFTKDILVRLMNKLPLTPIEGKDDEWKVIYIKLEGGMVLQNKRRTSLFKNVDIVDGEIAIEYYDGDSFTCYDHNTNTYESNCIPNSYLESYIPKIKMPYYPDTDKQYVFHVRDYPDKGLVHCMYLVHPNGEIEDINKYFANTDDGECHEITEIIFNELMR